MSWPKALSKMSEQLNRIEAKLDQVISETAMGISEESKQTYSMSDYDSLSVSEIVRRAKILSAEDRNKYLEYEKSHLNRSPVVGALSK